MAIIVVGNCIFWSCSPQKVFNNQHWIGIKSHLAVKPYWVPENKYQRNYKLSSENKTRMRRNLWASPYEMMCNYLEEGKRRCDKNFGTFPAFRISSYGRFFTTTTFHKPTYPLSSGTCPSINSLDSVCSSTNITKQTFFLEYSLIWRNKHHIQDMKNERIFNI